METVKICRVYPGLGMRANSYALTTSAGVTVIDPVHGPAEWPDIKLSLLLATHAHFDHTNAIPDWLQSDRALSYRIHAEDIPLTLDPYLNASALFGEPFTLPEPTFPLTESESVSIGDGYRLEVLHTPGHTPGSVCLILYQETSGPLALFSGDTLFASSIGRTDLPGGSYAQMQASLDKLRKEAETRQFPADLPVYPGHEEVTTWAEVLQNNPWLN